MREYKIKAVQPETTTHAVRRSLVACLVGLMLLTLGMVVAPTPSSARVSVGVFVNFGPPALPYYTQPPCPAPGYIWTPGYWAWDPAYGYFWVPGTWVPAPFIGALWTPGYWGWGGRGYLWHPGYWGYAVGFYGGIYYGFGYTGYGYHGGYWRHNRFYYNRSVNRIVGRNFRHVYSRRVNDRFRNRRISYNGGRGGINVRPTRRQLAAARRRRSGPISQQVRQQRFARSNPAQRARVNHGRPGIAATRRPGAFRGRDVVRATRAGAPYHAPARRTGGRSVEHSSRGRTSNRGSRSSGSSRNARTNVRRETRAPARQRVQRQVHRSSSPRNARQVQHQSQPQQMRRVNRAPVQQRTQRQVHRSSSPRNARQVQHQSRPQQTRRPNRAPVQQRAQRQVHRSSSPRNARQVQHQPSRRETHQAQSRPAQRHGNSAQQEEHGNGNGHGRGGRH
jgi:hypothetical protein